MATASFHARVERIKQSNRRLEPHLVNRRPMPLRGADLTPAADHATVSLGRASKPVARFLLPMSVGGTFGVLGGLALLGAATDGWLWGPGTAMNAVMLPVGLAAMSLAPLLMFAALVKGGGKPGLSLLALSYLSGFMLMLLV